MDLNRIIDKNAKRVDILRLKNAGYSNIRMMRRNEFGNMVRDLLKEETEGLKKERDGYKKQVDILQEKLKTQMDCIKELSKNKLDQTWFKDQMKEFQNSLKEEIQRQLALATISREGKKAVVDMDAFLDGIFKFGDLKPNIDQAKISTMKTKTQDGSVQKLKDIRNE